MDVATPEFVRWALRYDCELRAGWNGVEPERVERQLGTLRALADAVETGRTWQGFAFEPALDEPPGPARPAWGFRLADVLAAYEGGSAGALPCATCCAAVGAEPAAARVAHCYGLIDWSPVGAELSAAVDRVWFESGRAAQLEIEFTRTRPLWYGWWLESPLRPAQQSLLRDIVAEFTTLGPIWQRVFGEFAAALKTAHEQGLAVGVEYAPAGQCRGRNWIVQSHCRRCKAGRTLAQRVCTVCGDTAPAAPARRRLRRGRRPYAPLPHVESRANLAELVAGYLRRRGWPATAIREHLAYYADKFAPDPDISN